MINLYSNIKMMHGPIRIRCCYAFTRIRCGSQRANGRSQGDKSCCHYWKMNSAKALLRCGYSACKTRTRLNGVTVLKIVVFIVVI